MLCKRIAIIKEGRTIKMENIETLRRKQLKKLHIEPGDQMNGDNFKIQGIEQIITTHKNMLSFMYSGDINELVCLLAVNKLVNPTIEELSLEEIFMHYYK
jgi:ABC-2 type transport system ATP-binding protein